MNVKIHDIILISRPIQWVKNIVILLPVFYINNVHNSKNILFLLLSVLCFIIASSGVYAFNDVIDYESDRKSKYNKNRPIASGRVSRRTGYYFSFCAILLSCLISIRIGIWYFIAIYLITTFLYSLYGKHIPIMDILSIVFFFLIRLGIGLYVVNSKELNYLLMISFGFLFMFLILGKRYSGGKSHVIKYNDKKILYFIKLSIIISLITYLIYTYIINNIFEYIILLLFIYTALRYLRVYILNKNAVLIENIFIKDKQLFIAFILILICELIKIRVLL